MTKIFTGKSIVMVTTMLFSTLTSAKERVEVKCFVDFYGGGQSIYFVSLAKEDYKHLPDTLVNDKAYTISRDKKKKIYAVNECTLETNKFKNKVANKLEKLMTK